jgi:hypothetical protein
MRKPAIKTPAELSLCGDIDFIPTEQYGRDDAARAIEDARFVLDTLGGAVAAVYLDDSVDALESKLALIDRVSRHPGSSASARASADP